MNKKKLRPKLPRWIVRMAAVVAVPALFPASVSMGERIGWATSVLLWIYMGKLVDRKDSKEDASRQRLQGQ